MHRPISRSRVLSEFSGELRVTIAPYRIPILVLFCVAEVPAILFQRERLEIVSLFILGFFQNRDAHSRLVAQKRLDAEEYPTYSAFQN